MYIMVTINCKSILKYSIIKSEEDNNRKGGVYVEKDS